MNEFEEEIFKESLPVAMTDSEFYGCRFQSLDLSTLSLKNNRFIECQF